MAKCRGKILTSFDTNTGNGAARECCKELLLLLPIWWEMPNLFKCSNVAKMELLQY